MASSEAEETEAEESEDAGDDDPTLHTPDLCAAREQSLARYHAALQRIVDKYTAAAQDETADPGMTWDEVERALSAPVAEDMSGNEDTSSEEDHPAKRARQTPADRVERQTEVLTHRFREHMDTHALAIITLPDLCAVLGVNRMGTAVKSSVAHVKQALEGHPRAHELVRVGARDVTVYARETVELYFLPDLVRRKLKID